MFPYRLLLSKTLYKLTITDRQTEKATYRGTSLRQGGILAGSQGARLPRNIQAHTKFFQEFTLFWREFDFKVFPYFLSNEGILSITHNMQENFLVTGRNVLS